MSHRHNSEIKFVYYTSTALYIFVTLLSITAYPEDCSGWLDYIRNLDKYSGIEGLPAFYRAFA
jgi:hypothetical protein